MKWLILTLIAAGGTTKGAPQDPTATELPDERMWRQIREIAQPTPVIVPYESRFDAERARLDRLINQLLAYQTQFPGGERRREAIELELSARFQRVCLTGMTQRFENRCDELLTQSADEGARAHIERWRGIARRFAETRPESSQPAEASRATNSADPAARVEPPRNVTFTADDSRATCEPFDGAMGEALRRVGVCDRPVAVIFWASWDLRSLESAAMLARTRAEHPEFSVIGVSIDLNLERMHEAIDAYALDGEQIQADRGWASAALSTWRLRRLPAVILIDRVGRVITAEEDLEVSQIPKKLE